MAGLASDPYLKHISEASERAVEAQNALADARCATARAAGDSWSRIATVLGTSRQAAQERYGPSSERYDA